MDKGYLVLITINSQVNENKNVTTVKRKVFQQVLFGFSLSYLPKKRKLLQNMYSAIVIISVLRVKFWK